MAGANSVIRVVGAGLGLFVIVVVSWVGVKLYEPIDESLGGVPASLGWDPVNFLFFMALGLIGLVLTILIWLIVAPVRNDVRQERGPRRRF